jgi:glycosyltransferase involved in cell wall biosynthesis
MFSSELPKVVPKNGNMIFDKEINEILKFGEFFHKLKKRDCLFVSSLWEDPGFVIIEAAFCRTFIISSSFKICYKELILDQKAGLVFELNNKEDFMEKCKKFNEMSEEERNKYRKNALIMSKNFTIFRHAKQLHKILI